MSAQHGQLSWRPGLVVGRVVWRLLQALVAGVVTGVWFVVILLLPITRALLFYPLLLATMASFAAGVYFGGTGQWHQLMSAALAFVGGLAMLTAYLAIAKAIDPEFDRPREPNPWFWQ